MNSLELNLVNTILSKQGEWYGYTYGDNAIPSELNLDSLLWLDVECFALTNEREIQGILNLDKIDFEHSPIQTHGFVNITGMKMPLGQMTQSSNEDVKMIVVVYIEDVIQKVVLMLFNKDIVTPLNAVDILRDITNADAVGMDLIPEFWKYSNIDTFQKM